MRPKATNRVSPIDSARWSVDSVAAEGEQFLQLVASHQLHGSNGLRWGISLGVDLLGDDVVGELARQEKIHGLVVRRVQVHAKTPGTGLGGSGPVSAGEKRAENDILTNQLQSA